MAQSASSNNNGLLLCLQASMHASHEIIRRRAAEWAGNVVFIAISVDKSAGTVRERARERGWENAIHLWCGPGTWKSEPATILGIDGVTGAAIVGSMHDLMHSFVLCRSPLCWWWARMVLSFTEGLRMRCDMLETSNRNPNFRP